MFGIFCLSMGVFAFLFIRETKGKSLEDMDILFGSVDAQQRALDVERNLAKEFDFTDENKATSIRLEDVSKGV
jgi:hypothetical protein